MRIDGANNPMMPKRSATPGVEPAAAAKPARSLSSGDQFVSSQAPAKPLEPYVNEADVSFERRMKEAEKARWRRMMLFLLAGFKPTPQGNDVGIDQADAKRQEVRAGAR